MISAELLAYITNYLNQYFEEFSLKKPFRTFKNDSEVNKGLSEGYFSLKKVEF